MYQSLVGTNAMLCHAANSINGILTIVTLSKNSIRNGMNTRSHLISTKSAGSLFNSIVLSSVRNTEKIHTLVHQIYCLNESHNPVGDVNIFQNGQFPLISSEWFDTPTAMLLEYGTIRGCMASLQQLLFVCFFTLLTPTIGQTWGTWSSASKCG